ncbi:MAG TPA: hypothetical protein VJZ94_00300, partial [Candidatus Paceibacterota bacterium]|nr:hypothetical protein [Candidatus Paceibacterota bacterium]
MRNWFLDTNFRRDDVGIVTVIFVAFFTFFCSVTALILAAFLVNGSWLGMLLGPLFSGTLIALALTKGFNFRPRVAVGVAVGMALLFIGVAFDFSYIVRRAPPVYVWVSSAVDLGGFWLALRCFSE